MSESASTDAHPAFNAPPAADGKSTVPITAEEFAEFQRLKDLEPRFAELQAKHQADLATLTSKHGELAKALAELDTTRKSSDEQRAALEARIAEATGQAGAIRQRYLDRAKSEAIASALAGVEFVGQDAAVKARVAGRFREMIAPGFDIAEDANGNPTVTERGTGRPFAEAMAGLLDAPENQGFFAPRTRGGAGTDGTGYAGSTIHPSGNPHRPGSLEWHSLNLQRSRENNLSGLVLVNKS